MHKNDEQTIYNKENIRDHFRVADDFRNSGRVQEAVTKYQEIAIHAHALGMQIEEGQAYHMMGVSTKEVIAGNDENFTNADKYYQAAIRVFEEAKSPINIARVVRDQAIAYTYAGIYTNDALKLYQKSIDIFSSLGLDNEEVSGEMGITVDKYGLALLYAGNSKEARIKMQKAWALVQVGFNEFFKGTVLLDSSRIEIAAGNYSQAIEGLMQAEKTIQGVDGNHARRLAQIYQLMALCYEKLGKQDEHAKFTALFHKYNSVLNENAQHIIQDELQRIGR